MEVVYYDESFRDRVLEMDLCEAEAKELLALGEGKTVREMLEDSLSVSKHTWVAVEDGKVIAVGGISEHPYEAGMGIPWLLSTETFTRDYLFTINSLAYSLIEHSFNTLDFYVLTNRVSLDNKASIKWLKFLGFEFMESPRLINNVWFDTFYMYKEDYYV